MAGLQFSAGQKGHFQNNFSENALAVAQYTKSDPAPSN